MAYNNMCTCTKPCDNKIEEYIFSYYTTLVLDEWD